MSRAAALALQTVDTPLHCRSHLDEHRAAVLERDVARGGRGIVDRAHVAAVHPHAGYAVCGAPASNAITCAESNI